MRRPCMDCGQLHRGFTRCDPCRARALEPYKDPVYRANRQAILAGRPRCVLRIVCDGAVATTADHILALARGGTSTLANLQPACLPCNSAKRKGGRAR